MYLAMLHVNGFVRELKYTPVNVNQYVGECELKYTPVNVNQYVGECECIQSA